MRTQLDFFSLKAVPGGPETDSFHRTMHCACPLVLFIAASLGAAVSSCQTSALHTSDGATHVPRLPDGVPFVLAPRQETPTVTSAMTNLDPGDLSQEYFLVPAASMERALDVMAAFFAAIRNEDLAQLSLLLAPGCLWWSPTIGRAAASEALVVWRERFRRLSYALLADIPLVRRNEVRIVQDGQIDRLWTDSAARPVGVQPSDLLLQTMPVTPRVGPERLLGDTLVLWLRPVRGTFAIQAIVEDFVLP